MSQFKYSVGPWNVHPGADSYGPATRADIPADEKYKKICRDWIFSRAIRINLSAWKICVLPLIR